MLTVFMLQLVYQKVALEILSSMLLIDQKVGDINYVTGRLESWLTMYLYWSQKGQREANREARSKQ